jgi:hypothetical protein
MPLAANPNGRLPAVAGIGDVGRLEGGAVAGEPPRAGDGATTVGGLGDLGS